MAWVLPPPPYLRVYPDLALYLENNFQNRLQVARLHIKTYTIPRPVILWTCRNSQPCKGCATAPYVVTGLQPGPMLTNPPTLSVAEAAAATGFSRQAVHRAIKDGRLRRFLVRDAAGHCRLMSEAVGAIRSGILRQRIDTAPAAPPSPPAPAPAPAPPANPAQLWADIGTWANALLDLGRWGPPPWPPERWATLDIVLDQAEDLAAEHGPCTPELLAQLEQECES